LKVDPRFFSFQINEYFWRY